MAGEFFRELGSPRPHHCLGIGSGTHCDQTARTMLAYEAACRDKQPDSAIVVGDVNATLACALAGKQIGLPVAQVEAGLRSGDPTIPEELKRTVTDALADLVLAPSDHAVDNVRREGADPNSAAMLGNIIIDNLLWELLAIRAGVLAADVEMGGASSPCTGQATSTAMSV